MGAGITLGLLIKEGLLWPGKDVLSVEYKSVMTYATLTQDGQIVCKVASIAITLTSSETVELCNELHSVVQVPCAVVMNMPN